MNSLAHLTRFLIFRSNKSRDFLCVVAARDKKHALKVARSMFSLDRTAFALAERRPAEAAK